jgi:predicted DNA-binding transcriptional regulator AlpA
MAQFSVVEVPSFGPFMVGQGGAGRLWAGLGGSVRRRMGRALLRREGVVRRLGMTARLPELMSFRTVLDWLGVSRTTFRRWAREGCAPPRFKLGNHVFSRADEVAGKILGHETSRTVISLHYIERDVRHRIKPR